MKSSTIWSHSRLLRQREFEAGMCLVNHARRLWKVECKKCDSDVLALMVDGFIMICLMNSFCA